MKQLLKFCVVLLFFPGLLQAAGPAGIVIYSTHEETTWLLLADHKGNNRGWAAFGGMHENGETGIETAVRETEEETRRFFSAEDLKIKINGQFPVISGLFRFYFAEVDYVDAEKIESHPVAPGDTVAQERKNFTWIPVTEIQPLVCAESIIGLDFSINPAFLPAGKSSGSYWHMWIQNMRDANRLNAFPWLDQQPFCA